YEPNPRSDKPTDVILSGHASMMYDADNFYAAFLLRHSPNASLTLELAPQDARTGQPTSQRIQTLTVDHNNVIKLNGQPVPGAVVKRSRFTPADAALAAEMQDLIELSLPVSAM